MTPEKFFDYLKANCRRPSGNASSAPSFPTRNCSGNSSPLARFIAAWNAPPDESAATTRAGSRGRQLAAAFAVLVADERRARPLLHLSRRTNRPPRCARHRKKDSINRCKARLEKAAAAAFTPTQSRPEQIALVVPRKSRMRWPNRLSKPRPKAGGSGSKDLPNDKGMKVLVLVPASAEAQSSANARCARRPAPASAATPGAPSPNEPIDLEIVLSSPR